MSDRFPAEIDPAALTILVDQQEKNRLDVPFRVEIAHLEVGDYQLKHLGTRAVAERKSEEDLLCCLGVERDRFQRQVLRLLGCQHRVLVVESTWERLGAGNWRSQITPKSVLGSLAGLMADGLPIALVGSHEEAGRFVARWFYIIARRRLHECRGLLGEIRERPKTEAVA
ncbi:MAG TPA: ERCC4 domain-containing protein [Pirellulales bacterium]|jgi:ERCC4-type nuclease|nr:ERCC4 domain-containing protein [Pirellulales bacterium]